MPELPDLQVFCRNLNKILTGKTLKRITIINDKKLKSPALSFKHNLEKQILKEVVREGKELHFHFKNNNTLGLHLMLKGKLYLFEKQHEHKYGIIELLFDDEIGLVLTDFQGQATPTLNPEEREVPDALSDDMDVAFLKEQLHKSKATVKSVLLDQHVIRGIGNAYADEILWEARISPLSVCNKIPDAQVKVLTKTIKKVLQEAEKTILKTHPDIISGEVRDFLNIHNAKKKVSPAGGKILHTMVNSRKTYYTEEQTLFK